MTWTTYPVSQQSKITALRKHAAVLLQHHGQLLPSSNALWKLIKHHCQHQLEKQQEVEWPVVQL